MPAVYDIINKMTTVSQSRKLITILLASISSNCNFRKDIIGEIVSEFLKCKFNDESESE
jgi:hypothetical protein